MNEYKYVVRLRDYKGNIVDGEMYNTKNATQAKKAYLLRCKKHGITVGKSDSITVEKYEDVVNKPKSTQAKPKTTAKKTTPAPKKPTAKKSTAKPTTKPKTTAKKTATKRKSK